MQFLSLLFLESSNTVTKKMPQDTVAAVAEVAEQVIMFHKIRTGQILLQKRLS